MGVVRPIPRVAMLKIGLRLPQEFRNSGNDLAGARAMESAGADSLWLDDEGDDPALLLEGMATVTNRIRLIVPIPGAERRDLQNRSLRVATMSRLSRGRVALAVTKVAESSTGVDAVIQLAQRSATGVTHRAIGGQLS